MTLHTRGRRCVNCNCLSWELLAIEARNGTAEDKYSPPKRTRFKRGKRVPSKESAEKVTVPNAC